MTLDTDLRLHPSLAIDNGPYSAVKTISGRRLVYLLSRYPAVSHTFFLSEVRQLRDLGFDIDVASINEPDRMGSALSAAEAEEAAHTFYIKSTGATWAASIAAKTFFLRPRVFMRGLIAALRLGRWDPGATIYALFYFAEALVLGDWMRLRKHHHIHIHFSGPVATVGMITSIAWRIPYSLTVHGPDEFYEVDKLYLRQKVENASFIICISNFCRSQVMRTVGPEHWNKMQVVRLGVDASIFAPRRKVREANCKTEILCVGRLVPSKGQLILLQAAEDLTSKGFSVRVRLVGDGPDRRHLEAFANQGKTEVIFEGSKSHEEVRRLLADADFFVLASFAEGVPVALMEAMAMEIPCVSTNIAGIPELIRDGLDGLLVPASSVESLAAAIQRLIDDPALREGLAVAASKRTLEFYNLKGNICILAHILDQRVPDGA
jgi:colanic acid/amylovoran biosynthesis glycosyltransferase